MDVGREIMWNVGHTGQYVSYAFLIITAIVLILGLKKRYAMWKIGKPANIEFKKRLGERIGYFIANGIFHCVCPRCNGKKSGCHHCRKSGWMPKWALEEMESVA